MENKNQKIILDGGTPTYILSFIMRCWYLATSFLSSFFLFYIGIAMEGKHPWLLNHPPDFHGVIKKEYLRT